MRGSAGFQGVALIGRSDESWGFTSQVVCCVWVTVFWLGIGGVMVSPCTTQMAFVACFGLASLCFSGLLLVRCKQAAVSCFSLFHVCWVAYVFLAGTA